MNAPVASCRAPNTTGPIEAHGPDLTLTADKPIYVPGEVAKLELFSAIVPSHAIVSYASQCLVASRV